MSWYYSYYIGRKNNEKTDVIGVFDNNGKVHSALERSRSFASSLHELFERYHGEDYKELEEKLGGYISILPYKDLPKGSFVKSGYFLIEDVEKYLKDEDTWDIFYDHISPQVYAEKLKTECLLGRPSHVKLGKEGVELETEEDTRSCRDYMYFAYPDYSSKEYEAFIIREVVEMLEPYNFEKDDVVIILSEG